MLDKGVITSQGSWSRGAKVSSHYEEILFLEFSINISEVTETAKNDEDDYSTALYVLPLIIIWGASRFTVL